MPPPTLTCEDMFIHVDEEVMISIRTAHKKMIKL